MRRRWWRRERALKSQIENAGAKGTGIGRWRGEGGLKSQIKNELEEERVEGGRGGRGGMKSRIENEWEEGIGIERKDGSGQIEIAD